ncbi:hypothetical protein D3P07_09400 [Paenibacillus sp. 1011MAR3C5]|uniref:hypothetical protein n=1 Tax=Paenibacillus sp. 1011MAR3C5 TaxID=1675787 RepID=UPI000E6D24C9|nr:hypothetical protein [Paenibacillus sp. 1011MAR3C5]RJE90401.1 hypothetical protein D3P07_09400 [Paenibacillus sp. 1011MAR3C5]
MNDEMSATGQPTQEQPAQETLENDGRELVKLPDNYRDEVIYTTVNRGNAYEKRILQELLTIQLQFWRILQARREGVRHEVDMNYCNKNYFYKPILKHLVDGHEPGGNAPRLLLLFGGN